MRSRNVEVYDNLSVTAQAALVFIQDPNEVSDYHLQIGANDWATATVYAIGAYILGPDSAYYRCNKNHTSTSPFNVNQGWTPLQADLWMDDVEGDVLSGTLAVYINGVLNGLAPDLNTAAAAFTEDTNKGIGVFLKGGVLNQNYNVVVRWSTTWSPARVGERTFVVQCRQK